MNTNDLRHYASVYGGDLARWPDDLRRQVQVVLAAVPDMRVVLDEARCLDDRISAAAPVVDDDRVSRAIDRLMAERRPTPRHAVKRPRRLRFAPAWLVPAATCLCALALGLYLGMAGPFDTEAVASPDHSAVRQIFGVSDPLTL